MAVPRTVNFQSCCRLCLSDKQDQLKSVFDISADDRALPSKILQHVAVEITVNDNISKKICADCVNRINDWHSYKEKCVLNQNKLKDLAASATQPCTQLLSINPNISTFGYHPDMSIHIKDEPIDQDENDAQAENTTITIKNEQPESMEEEYIIDIPPPLTPAYRSEQDVSSEESQDSSTSNRTLSNVDEEKRKCPTCGKIFANVSNRKKHERMMHKDVAPLDLAKRNQMTEIASTYPNEAESETTKNNGSIDLHQEESQESTNSTEKSSEPACETDQQKIKFAAGLKLLEKNSTPISCEPLSKIELSYIEKCKAMVNMHKTLICACHNVEHPNLKGLLSHLRALRIWFPVFTCYNCMISFTDRSSFARHHVKCNRGPLETIEKLSNLRKRSEIKIRLYQNYKCTSCKFLYFFHEEYCKHVDEEHANGEPPFKCPCKQTFDNLEDYKSHVYFSCLINYYCDICFVTLKTTDEFLKHSQTKHDTSEGFILLQDDNYIQRKSLTKGNENPRESVSESSETPIEKQPEEDPVKTPVLELSEPSESKSTRPRRDRRSSAKATTVVESEDEESPPKINLRDQYSHLKHLKSKDAAKCPICNKAYSTYHNMLRHYKTHPLSDLELPTKEEVEQKNDNSALYSCPDCGGMYTSVDWIEHLESHPVKKCGMCEKSFQFQTELDQHKNSHLNIKVYRDTKTNVYKSSMVSPTQMLTCGDCNATFSSEDELESHKETHQIMNYSSADEMPMLEPLAVISEVKEEKKYPCTECGKVYASYNSLWGHNKDKHPEKSTASTEYPKKCNLCDKVCLTGTSFASHKRMHSRIAMGIFPKGKSSKQVTKKNENQEDESYHTCNRCFKVFSSKSNLRTHMESHKTSPTKTSPSKKTVKKVWCDICHVAFNSSELLSKHKEEEHNTDDMPKLTKEEELENKPAFKCEICDTAFMNKISLKKHKQEHHIVSAKTNKSLVYCRYCKISFESVMALTKHMHVEHNETAKPKVVKEGTRQLGPRNAKGDNKPHKCAICKKGFQTLPALQAHAGWHKRSKSKFAVPADSIPQKAISEKIEKHIKVMNKVTKAAPPIKAPEFQCMTCLVEFPNDTALQIHILETHRNVNAIMLVPRCNTCNKDFTTQEDYETHKRFHDFLERQKKHEITQQSVQITPVVIKPKSFPCKYCNSAFSRSDSLGAHVKQHHKEFVQTEFRCNQCDRVFEKQNSLSIHLKVHEKQRISNINGSTSKPLFHCSICNMGFDLPKDLRTHTISAHPF